ncbi:putative transcription antitermination factor, NusB family [Candidatus Protochlamydia naegleriophila]|uniref:Transcription antitermination protein NusB n=1 Tax=Candidatus Protochlamydia naegleriophila TaxID=389348 RepID=A0A0U5JAZ3_9BACT|nr:transcription antitermination factor NusB [Candidatus Protochlamydia naegleriophila]CUI17209.1 putative transcription antitermination factor, NusB family [Candidatus Protochlamydia naegleriophila]
MALSQQKFREIVFQLLYSQDIGHPDEAEMISLIMAELAVSKKNVRLAQEKMHLIVEKLAEIDSSISSVSTSYDFERIQTVTKNILRLGVFELFYDKGIPPKVAIAEAIRLSRKFSTPESASFVNALLDHLYQGSKGDKADPQILAQQAQTLAESEQAATDYSLEVPLIDEPDEDESPSHEHS